MRKTFLFLTLSVMSTMILAVPPPTAAAQAVSAEPRAADRAEGGFSCDAEEGRQRCRCSGLQDCVDMVASGICTGLTSSGETIDDIDCPKHPNGEAVGHCTCTRRRFEDAAAERSPGGGTARSAKEGRGIDTIGDGTSNTVMRTDVRDHRDGAPRGRRPRTADPSDAQPAGLRAPTRVLARDVTGTSLTLSWYDNSTREYGVAVERVDPVAARRDPRAGWERIGNFEERIHDRVVGTGGRSDSDTGLTPGTEYCYRLRAYSGFSMSEVSDYSEILCVQTGPADEPGTASPRH